MIHYRSLLRPTVFLQALLIDHHGGSTAYLFAYEFPVRIIIAAKGVCWCVALKGKPVAKLIDIYYHVDVNFR